MLAVKNSRTRWAVAESGEKRAGSWITAGFSLSLSRPHLDPQTARPAMSNSRLGEVRVLWENGGRVKSYGS